MIPHVLVDVSIGPGFQWSRVYGVVKLEHLLGNKRPSRANIRYTAEVFFPDCILYPIRQRWKLAGASRDESFPFPVVVDDSEDWRLQQSDISDESVVEGRDGAMDENAPKSCWTTI